MKKELYEKLNNDEVLSSEQVGQLLDHMMSNIGNPDPIIRDVNVYNGFCKLLLEDKISITKIPSIIDECIFNLSKKSY